MAVLPLQTQTAIISPKLLFGEMFSTGVSFQHCRLFFCVCFIFWLVSCFQDVQYLLLDTWPFQTVNSRCSYTIFLDRHEFSCWSAATLCIVVITASATSSCPVPSLDQSVGALLDQIAVVAQPRVFQSSGRCGFCADAMGMAAVFAFLSCHSVLQSRSSLLQCKKGLFSKMYLHIRSNWK